MRIKTLALLLLLTAASIIVHGYHLGIEDEAIYLPAIKKLINPLLYPFDAQFFQSQTRYSLFSLLVSLPTRILHIPLEWVIMSFHALSIFLVLLACWRIASRLFNGTAARWAAVSFVASLFTMPVAGTALFLVDQHLHQRTLATAGVLFAIDFSLRGRHVIAVAILSVTILIHPLMAALGIPLILLMTIRIPKIWNPGFAAALFLPFTSAWEEALKTQNDYFLTKWSWYELAGAFIPLFLIFMISRYRRQDDTFPFRPICRTLALYELILLTTSLAIDRTPSLIALVPTQLMRGLLFIYLLVIIILGGLIAESFLKKSIWRWAVVFLPICIAMFMAQRAEFPSSPHIELPWMEPDSCWMQTCRWIRNNTPRDAYCVIDPSQMSCDGADEHGFRALAERSMLADRGKDAAVVTLAPDIAQKWNDQVTAQEGLRNFTIENFRELQRSFGVDYVILDRPVVQGLLCVYSNGELNVYRIPKGY